MERKRGEGMSSGVTLPILVNGDLHTWLAECGRKYGLRWLLAHADNGIIWGDLREEELKLSSEAFGPAELRLDVLTLQQARLFGEAGELRLWQGPGGLSAFLRRDGEGAEAEWLDETYLLWGNLSGETRDGFTELLEGRQGIRHAPPLSFTPSDKRRAALRVRHYLAADDDGVVRIVDGRLVALLDTAWT